MELAAHIQELNQKVKGESGIIQELAREIHRVIVGQKYMVERLLIGLLSRGHILLEGVPGLAKTLTIKTLSSAVDTKFQRIQFTPDLLPADLVGTMIFNQKDGTFSPKKGPIFANIILADEINRAPAKVQSALLEAMQERQVDHRRALLPARGAFSRPGDTKPDRARRNLSPPGGTNRPVYAQAARRLS